MLKFKLNPNSMRLPIGGHHFPDNGTTFKDESFTDLQTQVRTFRINNGIAVGDPEQEILHYYAIHWPYLVLNGTAEEDPPPPARYMGWRDWIYKTWKNPPKVLIPAKEAKERWAKCELCKYNLSKNWDETDESEELDRRAFMLRRGLDNPAYLGYCSYHRCDLGVFVFLSDPLKFSSKTTSIDFPDCWVKPKELNG